MQKDLKDIGRTWRMWEGLRGCGRTGKMTLVKQVTVLMWCHTLNVYSLVVRLTEPITLH